MPRRRRGFWRHLLAGIRFGYPLCCVLRYAWEARGSRSPKQAVARGVVRINDDKQYVPCRLRRHAGAMSFGEDGRYWRRKSRGRPSAA